MMRRAMCAALAVITSVSVAAVATPAAARTAVLTKTLLDQLQVAAEHTAGYNLSAFKLWDDQGGGCDTRDRVLITEAIKKPHVGKDCTLTGGKWLSLYDDTTTTQPSTFDIDHLVPLAEAWQSGAYRWSAKTREAYANDLGYGPDLVAVSAHANLLKSDSGPAEWMPADRRYSCAYDERIVTILTHYRLEVTGAAMSRVLAHC